MDCSDFSYLEVKVLFDREFVKLLIENPVQALRSAGVQITPEVFEAIKGIDGSTYEKLMDTLKRDDTRK